MGRCCRAPRLRAGARGDAGNRRKAGRNQASRSALRRADQTIIVAEGASIFEPLITSGKVDELADPRQIAGLKASLEIPAKDYLKAMRIRTIVQQKIRQLFADVDVLLAPSRFGPAPKISEPLDKLLMTPSRKILASAL